MCSDMVALTDTEVFQCEFWTFSLKALQQFLWFSFCLLILFVTDQDVLFLWFSFDNFGVRKRALEGPELMK